jgi:hypothetical protein
MKNITNLVMKLATTPWEKLATLQNTRPHKHTSNTPNTTLRQHSRDKINKCRYRKQAYKHSRHNTPPTLQSEDLQHHWSALNGTVVAREKQIGKATKMSTTMMTGQDTESHPSTTAHLSCGTIFFLLHLFNLSFTMIGLGLAPPSCSYPSCPFSFKRHPIVLPIQGN